MWRFLLCRPTVLISDIYLVPNYFVPTSLFHTHFTSLDIHQFLHAFLPPFLYLPSFLLFPCPSIEVNTSAWVPNFLYWKEIAHFAIQIRPVGTKAYTYDSNLAVTVHKCWGQHSCLSCILLPYIQFNDQSLQDEEGNFEPSNKIISELPNEQYNSVFSTLDPTMTIKYPKVFFGHPQANTLSDINITREDIIDAIKKYLTKLF